MSLIRFNEDTQYQDAIVYSNIKFRDGSWKIQWAQSEHIMLNFDSIELGQTKLKDYNDLYLFTKILTYYNFPKKVNLKISSWATTNMMLSALNLFLKNFVWPNQLLSSTMLASITTTQLSEHLDNLLEKMRTKQAGSAHEYSMFISVMKTWSTLTETNLLPPQFNLNVSIDSILTKKLVRVGQSLILMNKTTWQPLEPEIIGTCYKESNRYIYEYANCIIKCQELIRNRPKVGIKNKVYGNVRIDGKSKDLFISLKNMKVPMIDSSTKLFNFVPVSKEVKSHGYASGFQMRTTINITEVRSEVIQLKRACIFIIGLFTGMRRREIAELKSNPAYLMNGDWYLSITRFKTSDDASGDGEPDDIPVPVIVKDAIDILIRLFDTNRKKLDSSYLLVTDILSIKEYEKIKINTVSKDVTRFVENITGVSAHSHQLRKTIAWLLISRSEHNVDLIRQLFGHKSYGMTLRYILRNELMVQNVMELIEHNYTEDLSQVFQDIVDGKTNGELSDIIKNRINSRKYKGQILVTDIESFVKETIRSGIPMFISKLPIGAFCLMAGDKTSITPCMEKTNSKKPNVDFCNYKECKFVLHTEESQLSINKQIEYYEKKLSYLNEDSDERLVSYYENEINDHKNLLDKLMNKPDQKIKVKVDYA